MGRTRLRLLIAIVAIFTLIGPAAATAAAKPSEDKPEREHTVLDLLGAATPETQFSVFGSTGRSVSSTQNRGPMFTLSRPTMITEVGAFLNNCASIVGGVAQCPDPQPLMVDIRPDLGGRPDPNVVLARLQLSHDNDPYVVSYEFVRERIHLKAGTYYALFAPSAPGDEGFLLESASDLSGYQAGIGVDGVIDPADAEATSRTEIGPQAVRILAAGKDHARLRSSDAEAEFAGDAATVTVGDAEFAGDAEAQIAGDAATGTVAEVFTEPGPDQGAARRNDVPGPKGNRPRAS